MLQKNFKDIFILFKNYSCKKLLKILIKSTRNNDFEKDVKTLCWNSAMQFLFLTYTITPKGMI